MTPNVQFHPCFLYAVQLGHPGDFLFEIFPVAFQFFPLVLDLSKFLSGLGLKRKKVDNEYGWIRPGLDTDEYTLCQLLADRLDTDEYT